MQKETYFPHIYKLKKRLGWNKKEFINMLEKVDNKGLVELHQGDPKKLTEQQLRNSYFNKDWRVTFLGITTSDR